MYVPGFSPSLGQPGGVEGQTPLILASMMSVCVLLGQPQEFLVGAAVVGVQPDWPAQTGSVVAEVTALIVSVCQLTSVQ